MPNKMYKAQEREDIFALDIGTRSIIGVVGRVENGRLHVLAIEKENHSQRAMLDGQIENIDQVARVARNVVDRLENRLRIHLDHVCVAAAGRALKSEQAQFTLELPTVRQIGEDAIGQLEAGAVSKAEEALMSQPEQQNARLYMVGYTPAQYMLDGYPMSTLKGHSGKVMEVSVVATFLPKEVVESLYAVVNQLGMEVASMTLEPIAAINAAIPTDIRLLNLVLVDIGAGTSDIAVCRDGSVVGYTMATIAGDETTELLMRNLLVDFQTGEHLKAALVNDEETIRYEDILGTQHEISAANLLTLVRPSAEMLAKEISRSVVDLNGKAPSAVFLAGGGSKLSGLRELVADELGIDPNRVAIAGNHFAKSAFSDEYDLDDPEYATPLGIAISAAMGMINDSYVITLNGEPAKLFRSGILTLRDILMTNGYHYADLVGRTGANLSVMLNGERKFFYGALASPPEMTLNGAPADLMDIVHAGDEVIFIPARSGKDAERTVGDLVGADFDGQVLVNGARAALTDKLHTGDEIWVDGDFDDPAPRRSRRTAPDAAAEEPAAEPEPPVPEEALKSALRPIHVTLNGSPLHLPGKPSGEPYYLMDLLEYSGVDFDHLEKPVELWVNGSFGQFSQQLQENDDVTIR